MHEYVDLFNHLVARSALKAAKFINHSPFIFRWMPNYFNLLLRQHPQLHDILTLSRQVDDQSPLTEEAR